MIYIIVLQELEAICTFFVPNSSFGKRRIKYECSVLWNSLPLKVFKKNIKNHLNLLCISDWIIDKSEPKSDFEIVLNGHGIRIQ